MKEEHRAEFETLEGLLKWYRIEERHEFFSVLVRDGVTLETIQDAVETEKFDMVETDYAPEGWVGTDGGDDDF